MYSLAGVQYYEEIKGISICEFLPPHLSIYIDQPAEEVQKKLKQSGKVAARTLHERLDVQKMFLLRPITR